MAHGCQCWVLLLLHVCAVQGFCLDVGYTLAPNPCVVQPGQAMPFCDVNAPVAVRVASLVANLTLDEKLGLFANSADGVPRLNIPSYEWWSEGLHGVAYSAGVSFGGLFPAATSFPQVRS